MNGGGAPIGGGGSAASLKNFEFDFGLPGRQSSRPLNDQKTQYSSSSSSYSSFSYSGNPPASGPNKPSWSHQPAPATRPAQVGTRDAGIGSLSGSTSMVGDIFGKSWLQQPISSSASKTGVGQAGIVGTNPNLFSDLVGSAFGQGKSSNAPLKDSAPKGSFSMGNLAGSLPKSNPLGSANSRSSESLGSFASETHQSKNGSSSFAARGNSDPFGSLGTGNWRPSSNSGSVPMTQMKKNPGVSSSEKLGGDPFASFADFGSRKPPSASQQSSSAASNSDLGSGFGDFQDAPAVNKPSSFSTPKPSDSFGIPTPGTYSQEPAGKSGGGDSLDMLFASASAAQASAHQPASEHDDWGFSSEFGGSADTGTTTELEGLPPPPAGVTASTAKSKGLENYKQGQFADAIKWLSWAITLLGKSGDNSSNEEVLTCRASCYKEVGEYKKAIADCSKVLDRDSKNVAVLVQRALLYESTEKYKLGAEDLRMVMKIDPGNRVARGTLHRLTKLADYS
ncbi:Sperm-associated antigen 1A [Nymphaea thermarum]|nr:Sperm-associated antigen 1A [Nymphaea thermarum]